ncbi:MAG: DUF4974 domain-containing protein [Bacteroidales bacterium]|nr:DUF4974 domain-containing protein [Bacteroidales bacterium]
MKPEESKKIERYTKGVAGNTEKRFVESLFIEGEANPSLRSYLEKDWYSFTDHETLSETELSHVLGRIHHIIRRNEGKRSLTASQRIFKFYMRAAAVILIPLLIAGVYVYNNLSYKKHLVENEQMAARIFAPLGSRVSFSLPDGTKGMLNSGSHLDYSSPFSYDRKVKLEGEAWFEVSPDEKHPFEITAGSSVVKVLGTSFNISAYPAENYIEIVLNSGKIEYHSNDSNEDMVLFPSERLIYSEGRTSKSVVDPEKYNAWTEGKLVFRGDPMAEVARRIERWYNVKISIADKELEKYSFRATFQDDSLEDVLKYLAMTSPIQYRILPRILLPDGTFDKHEITIYKKNKSV